VKLAPYQWRWFDDRSPRRATNKSRRVGFSEAVSLRSAARACGLRLRSTGWEECRPANQNLLSASFPQSMLLLARTMRHYDTLAAGIPGIPRIVKRSALQCVLSNGITLVALSTNPRAARGLEGDLRCDEWASAPHQRELWAAAAPLAAPTLGNPEGYEIDIISTPLGDQDMFYEMCEGGMSDGFSQHRVSIYDAIADGFPINDEQLEQLKRDYDDEMFEQEFNCSFLAANLRYISAETYDAAMYDAGEGEWDPNKRSLRDLMFFGGIDVARRKHLTAFCKLKKDPDGVAWHDYTDAIDHKRIIRQGEDGAVTKGASWDEQEEWAAKHGRGCAMVGVDATGMGSMFAERLSNRLSGRVEAVDFTPAMKEELATGMRLGLERKRLRPRRDDVDTRRDVLNMRRKVTEHGNIRYDIAEDGKGHGDKGWAMAISYRQAGGATRTTRKPVIKSTLNVGPPPPERSVRVKRGAWR
jgi:phage FluMu gp28-like protein